jgi:hypothetical protein
VSYEECEYLNSLTAPRAAKRLRTQKAINVAAWGLVFLLGFLSGRKLGAEDVVHFRKVLGGLFCCEGRRCQGQNQNHGHHQGKQTVHRTSFTHTVFSSFLKYSGLPKPGTRCLVKKQARGSDHCYRTILTRETQGANRVILCLTL